MHVILSWLRRLNPVRRAELRYRKASPRDPKLRDLEAARIKSARRTERLRQSWPERDVYPPRREDVCDG